MAEKIPQNKEEFDTHSVPNAVPIKDQLLHEQIRRAEIKRGTKPNPEPGIADVDISGFKAPQYTPLELRNKLRELVKCLQK